jgi:hypothetical protein
VVKGKINKGKDWIRKGGKLLKDARMTSMAGILAAIKTLVKIEII